VPVTNDFVRIAADSIGKRIDNESIQNVEVSESSTTITTDVYRQRVQIGGSLLEEVAAVTSTAPGAGAFGQVVRVAESVGVSGAVAVSGSVLVSGAVSVSGSVQVSGAVSISAMPAVSISVSAVLGTVVTLLGTVLVSVSGVTVVSAPVASSVFGLPVYVAGGQSIAGGNPIWVSASNAIPVSGVFTSVQFSDSQSVVVSGPAGTAIAFSYSTAVAGTVLTTLLMNIALNYTSQSTSNFVVPSGKILRLLNANVMVQNTVAVIARGDFFIVAATSVSAGTTSPVYGYIAAAAFTAVAGVRGVAQVVFGPGMDFSAGVKVGFNMFISGTSSQAAAWIVCGALFP
jgi:hypothetical protein